MQGTSLKGNVKSEEVSCNANQRRYFTVKIAGHNDWIAALHVIILPLDLKNSGKKLKRHAIFIFIAHFIPSATQCALHKTNHFTARAGNVNSQEQHKNIKIKKC